MDEPARIYISLDYSDNDNPACDMRVRENVANTTMIFSFDRAVVESLMEYFDMHPFEDGCELVFEDTGTMIRPADLMPPPNFYGN